jgi:hypothetical protein
MSHVPINYPLTLVTNPGSQWSMTNANDILLCAVNCRVDMHDPLTSLRKTFTIKNYSGQTVVVYPPAGMTIDFGASISLAKPMSCVVLFPHDNSHWWIVGSYNYP